MIRYVKKILLGIAILCLFSPMLVQANEKVNLYFFWGDGCPHCAQEKLVLEQLKNKYSELNVYYYEVWNNQNNKKILDRVGKALKEKISGIPFTVIGTNTFTGFFP